MQVRLASLEARLKEQADIEELASRRAEGAFKTLGHWQAYDALHTAVRSGAPFVTALEAWHTQTTHAPLLLKAATPLVSTAPTGVPSVVHLRASFARAARDASRLSPLEERPTWTQRLQHAFGPLVTIRNTNPHTAHGTDALLAKADAALAADAPAAALEALAALPPAMQEPLAPVVDAITQRAEAFAALAAIRAALLSLSKTEP